MKKHAPQRQPGRHPGWFAYLTETPRWVLTFLILLLLAFWLAAQGLSALATAWRAEPDRARPP